MKLYDMPIKIYGVFKGNNLIGGLCGFKTPFCFLSGYPHPVIPLIPYQGILCMNQPEAKSAAIMSLQMELGETLGEFLDKEYQRVGISNHYNFRDMRSFKWNHYEVGVNATYLIPQNEWYSSSMDLEKDTRYVIKQSECEGLITRTGTKQEFNNLYTVTFDRKKMERPIDSDFFYRMVQTIPCDIRVAVKDNEVVAGTVFIEDTHRAYYILGASDGTGASSLLLWESLKNVVPRKEVDLVGCNNREIGLFKRGFGGQHENYYTAKKGI